MKVTLEQLLRNKKAAKVIVALKDKNNVVQKQTSYPAKGFQMSVLPKAGRIRFRILTADDQYIGQRDIVLGQTHKKAS